MANYYVRKSGSDSNTGTNPNTDAWLTIQNAISNTSGGDTIYIGAGVYRETLSFPMGVSLTLIGDVDGSHTAGDAGEVRVTAYQSGDQTSPIASILIDLSSMASGITFKHITFVGGASNLCNGSNSQNITFNECSFYHLYPGATSFTFSGSQFASAWTWTIDRCQFFYNNGTTKDLFDMNPIVNNSSDYDIVMNVTNCLFCGVTRNVFKLTSFSDPYAINLPGSSFPSGGLTVKNCTFIGAGTVAKTSSWSTTYPCLLYNNICVVDCLANASVSGEITEDYNHYAYSTANTNVTTGSNSKNNGTSWAMLLDIGHEVLVGKLLRPFGTPYLDSPDLAFGGNSPPSVDMLNRPRPSGGAVTWNSTNKAIGCLERHDFGVKETTTFDTGPSSLKFTGPGDQMLQVPVSNVSTTISVKVRWDNNYGAGTKPQLQILDAPEIGVTGSTTTATGSANTFNTISPSSFTPTAKGWVNVLLISNAAANGIVYWDTFNVT
jgi:hypothetical protein